MMDLSHLRALQERRSRERAWLNNAIAHDNRREAAFRKHNLAITEREIAGELKFLGLTAEPAPGADVESMSADEILRELGL